jgi:hypothetical protein
MAVASIVWEERDLLGDGRMSTFGQAVFVERSAFPGWVRIFSCQADLEDTKDAHVG